MSDNTKIWDALAKTDPKHTKGFSRAGGFKGTAVKPIYCDERMTQQFGPCGEGWGITKPEFQLVPAGNELLVFCTVSIWHGKPENLVYGVGGDKVIVQQSSGLRASDEAFKMAFTDAIGNAMKHLGMSADIHMGLFDDTKYVNDLKREFAEGDHTGGQDGHAGGKTKDTDPSEHPNFLPVLAKADGSGSDWAGWRDTLMIRLNKAESVDEVNDLMQRNKAALETLSTAAPKTGTAIRGLAASRLAAHSQAPNGKAA